MGGVLTSGPLFGRRGTDPACTGKPVTHDPPSRDRANGPGILYLVATPIGNLEDISRRALRVLAEVDLIAAEDTRHTRRLLAHYGIDTRVVSLFEHNERSRIPEMLERLQGGGRVAVVTDAG